MPGKFKIEKLKMESKQIQKGGDNSQQIQMISPTFNMGIDEKRAREIFTEMSEKAIANNTAQATDIANKRINQFEEKLLPRIRQIEEDFNSFSEPAFQVLLRKAQLTAACTEREDDYKMLSELLVHRVKNKENVKKKASITKAIEILDNIDDDSLCALTIFLAIEEFSPISGNITEGLSVLDNLYSRLHVDDLPNDTLWIDNLSILGAINTVSFGRLKKYEQYMSEILSGYVCVGIKKDSEKYAKAVELLKSNNISENILVDNEFLPDYVRLQIRNKQSIINDSVVLQEIYTNNHVTVVKIDFSESQKNCLREIYNMYESNSSLMKDVNSCFVEKIDSYSNILKAKKWWNSLGCSIKLTSVGKVIGHTNAKSIDPTIPDLD